MIEFDVLGYLVWLFCIIHKSQHPYLRDVFYADGQVRALFDDGGNRVKEAGPSIPVQVFSPLYLYLSIYHDSLSPNANNICLSLIAPLTSHNKNVEPLKIINVLVAPKKVNVKTHHLVKEEEACYNKFKTSSCKVKK